MASLIQRCLVILFAAFLALTPAVLEGKTRARKPVVRTSAKVKKAPAKAVTARAKTKGKAVVAKAKPAARGSRTVRAARGRGERRAVAGRGRRAARFVAVRGRGHRGGRQVRLSRGRLPIPSGPRVYVAGGPWLEPSFGDSTLGDRVDGEDLMVRRAAVEALGSYNGTIVVADPHTGRLLTVVNQKLAFRDGFQPCSTVKVYAAMAGASEGFIDRDAQMPMSGRLDLTDALARSNNPYFANIGVRLGYDRMAHYAKLYGLGEKAGWGIEEEQAGILPDGPPRNGGMAMMTSFGEGITLTPLQLAAFLSSIANGGTLYYLQYPKTPVEAQHLLPRVKRTLDIQKHIAELRPGMMGAVEFGSARRAGFDPNEPIFGKTGTCTDRRSPAHLGWFGSFIEAGGRKLVAVVLLTGGREVSGPVASGVAGQFYRNLSAQQFWTMDRRTTPVPLP